VFIVQTGSPRELDSLLLEIRFRGITKTKVTPLQDFEDRRDQDQQGVGQLKQSLQQQELLSLSRSQGLTQPRLFLRLLGFWR
jgi:hypothetical protein